MARISWFSVSLASKCRILFGSAVLLIIAAALFIPWLRMKDLVDEANLHSARLMGRLALSRSNLSATGWDQAQIALARWWPSGAQGQLGLRGPVPKLIPLSDPSDPKPPAGADEFTSRSIQVLAQNSALTEAPPQLDELEGGGLVYRIALPVRAIDGRYPAGTLLGVVSVAYPTASARVELLTNLGLSLMAGALAGILAVLVFYLITNRLILSPVRELTEVAKSVSQGEHSVRSQIATGDEFEELARAFNAMLAHLQASENELKTINRSLDTRLGELAERNVALFESNKLKSQFLANVSHELRTPLTSIIGFAELLREASAGDGGAGGASGRFLRYSENIMSSGRLLLGIINDLLDLAKIEAGRMELHLGQVELPQLADNLIDFMRPLAQKKNLQLAADVPDSFPTIVSDSGRIQQILYNLLSNAVKFTADGGVVELKLRDQGDGHVTLAVRDTGVGIAPEQMANVFEKFRQLDESMTREHGGTGLGLAISKELAAVLGGTITVESEVGKGSIFTVRLPVHAPDPVAQHAEVRLN